MNTNTHTQVEILVAVYRPNPAYLRAQLESLDAQDYPALRILLLDDSGDAAHSAAIRSIVEETLVRHPWRLERNAQNLGVQATFGRLTELSTAPLLAYCDQDDIWLPEKVSRLATLLAGTDDPYVEGNSNPGQASPGENGCTAAYSNLSIIDGQGHQRYPTLQAMNPRFTHKSGAGLFPYFLQDNCITGTTLMIRADVAKAALPFPAAYVQDQWLALWAAAGTIAYDPAPLVRYRLHGSNVVGMDSLHGVTDRQSYVSERLRPQMEMLDAARARFREPAQRAEIDRQAKALSRRIDYVARRRLYLLPSLVHALWRDPLRLGFEVLLGLSTQRMGARLVAYAKKN